MGENCYKMVYYTLCLGSVNCQISRWKIRIYADEKTIFSERGLTLTQWAKSPKKTV